VSSYLLAYFESDFSEDDVLKLGTRVDALRVERSWTLKSPEVINQFEEDSRSAPEDEEVRTVGAVLHTSDPGETPATPVEELLAFIDAMSKFSKEHGIDFGIQYRDEDIASITNGVPDDGLLQSLNEHW